MLRSRARTRSGADLLAELVTGAVPLRAPGGDETVAAAVGRLGGLPVVGVAVAAVLGGRPTPDGYRLATRAFRLAARWGLPVLSLVDTPGAAPGTVAEEGGIAPAMGEALDALLDCPTPTLALVHGEGGSGGALAVAAADRVLVTDEAYFAAHRPEGRQARRCAAGRRSARTGCASRPPTCSPWASPTRSSTRPTPPPTWSSCPLCRVRTRLPAVASAGGHRSRADCDVFVM